MISLRRSSNYALVFLLAAVVLYYGLIHWRLIWLVEPATAREPAVVEVVRGYLDPTAPPPYSLQSIPRYANLYGMGFVWGAAPFAALLPYSDSENLRIANAFYLGLLLLALAYGLRRSPVLHQATGLVLVYALFVGSPSIAASPDILACTLYTAAWLVAAESGLKAVPLGLSIILGFLALLTKPYLVLAVPAIGSYLFFFRTIRSGVYYTLATLIVFGAGFCLIQRLYPYYMDSVFFVHGSSTTRNPKIALWQWGEFSALAPIPFIAALVLGGRWIRNNFARLKLCFRWNMPVINQGAPVSLYAWGVLVASAVLAASLSWHGGAHMIYFWHLLLPLLLLLVFQLEWIHPAWLCINLMALIALRPPLPSPDLPNEWRAFQEIFERYPKLYVDPFFESLLPKTPHDLLRENAQAEYLLAHAIESSDPLLCARAEQVLQGERSALENRSYDGLLLTEGIFYRDHLMPFILSNYKVVGVYSVHSYFLRFRHRLSFGESPYRVLLLEPLPSPGMAGTSSSSTRAGQ